MDPEQQELEEQLRQLNETISSFTGAVAGIVKPINDLTASIGKSTTAENTNTETTKQNTGSVDRIAEANKKAAEVGSEASRKIASSFDTLKGAAKSFTQSVLSNEEGFTKYGNTVNQVGTASLELGRSFGALGTALGLVGFGLGKVAEAALAQADGLLKGLDDLSGMGAAGQITSKQLFGMAHNMGLTSQNIDIFTKSVDRTRTSMMALGGTAGDGIVSLAKMFSVTADQRQAFQRLGIDQEQLMGRMADYVDLQVQSGAIMDRSAVQSGAAQKNALLYVETLSVISSVTGKNAEEAKQGMIRAKASFDMQIHTARLTAELNDPKTSDNRKLEIQKRLLIEAELVNVAEQTGDAEYLAAVQSKLATGVYTEASTTLINRRIDLDQIMAANMSRSLESIEADRGAGEARAQLLYQQRQGLDRNIRDVGTAGTFSPEVQRIFGLTVPFMQSMAANQGRTLEDFRAQGEAARRAIGDPSSGTTGKAVAEDPAQVARNKMTQLQIDAAQALDELVFSMNPLLGNTGMFTAFAVTAGLVTAAFATIIATKGVQALLGRGGAAAGAASSVAEIAEDQLLDKNGRPLRGGARSARIAKLTGGGPAQVGKPGGGPAQVGKPGGFGASLQSVASALSNAGKAGPQVILGAAALATAIASFGAGIAGAVAVIGKALPSLANGLKAFNDLNGKNLQQAGLGMAGLGIGILAMGAGTMAQAFGTIIRFFTGDKDPLTQASEMLFRLQAVNLDRKKIEDNSASLMAYAKAMAAVAALGAGAGIADAVRSYFDGIGKLFGATPPYKDLEKFSQLQVDPAKVKINSDSFVEFSRAMASYSGYGDGLSVITSSLAQATVSFFNTNPPEKQVVEFSKLKIDPKQTSINATGFVEFSRAMAAYKGGVGLREAVSIIAGAKLSTLFGMDGPIKSFENFAAINVGPKAAENSQAFLNFSKAMGVLSGGSGGGWFNNLVSDLREPVARTVNRGREIVGQAVDRGGELVTQVGTAVGDFARGLFTRPGPDSTALNFIGRIESGNNYNRLVGGRVKNDPPLTSMTVGQVMAYQDTMRNNGHESTALGKYQIIKGTLGGIVRSGTVNPNDQFSETTQDKAAIYLMNVRGRERFRSGRLGVDQYANNLAKEWASLPMPNGRSYYAGVGSNNSLASRSDFVRSLQARDGGIMSGPSTGYPIELHGTELIIPIDSNSILSKLASTSAEAVVKDLQRKGVKAVPKPTSTTGIPKKTVGISKEMIYALSVKFDTVVNKIENTDQVQKKLLKQVL